MTFYIQNVETGYVLDVKGANASSFGEIIMYSSHGNSNQLWTYNNGMVYSKSNGYVDTKLLVIVLEGSAFQNGIGYKSNYKKDNNISTPW